MEILIILSFFALATKHFIVDFPLQVWPYLYEHKHKYGHPGGLLHALLHVIGTFIALSFLIYYGYSFELIISLAIVDGIVHYHIDWMKMNMSRNLKCDKDAEFWVWLGLDQYLHYATYVVMLTFLFL